MKDMHMLRQRCIQDIKTNKKLLVHFSGSYKYIALEYCYLIILMVMCKKCKPMKHISHSQSPSCEPQPATADLIVLFCLPLPSVFTPVCTSEQITNADLPCHSLLHNMCSLWGILRNSINYVGADPLQWIYFHILWICLLSW